jgi:hypothetical protein
VRSSTAPQRTDPPSRLPGRQAGRQKILAGRQAAWAARCNRQAGRRAGRQADWAGRQAGRKAVDIVWFIAITIYYGLLHNILTWLSMAILIIDNIAMFGATYYWLIFEQYNRVHNIQSMIHT